MWWNDKLYYVDIQGFALANYDPVTGKEQVWEVGERIGFALPCASGRWIWGGDHGLYFIDLAVASLPRYSTRKPACPTTDSMTQASLPMGDCLRAPFP